jgi:hypothetical protein
MPIRPSALAFVFSLAGLAIWSLFFWLLSAFLPLLQFQTIRLVLGTLPWATTENKIRTVLIVYNHAVNRLVFEIMM